MNKKIMLSDILMLFDRIPTEKYFVEDLEKKQEIIPVKNKKEIWEVNIKDKIYYFYNPGIHISSAKKKEEKEKKLDLEFKTKIKKLEEIEREKIRDLLMERRLIPAEVADEISKYYSLFDRENRKKIVIGNIIKIFSKLLSEIREIKKNRMEVIFYIHSCSIEIHESILDIFSSCYNNLEYYHFFSKEDIRTKIKKEEENERRRNRIQKITNEKIVWRLSKQLGSMINDENITLFYTHFMIDEVLQYFMMSFFDISNESNFFVQSTKILAYTW